MPIVIPSLTSDTTSTWVTGPLARGRLLLTNYLLTDRWQSANYAETIFSVVDILLETPDDDAEMMRKVRSSLSTLFELHFTNVEVSIHLEELPIKTLSIGITWTHAGEKYSIPDYTVTLNDVLSRVVHEHNTGDPLNATRYF